MYVHCSLMVKICCMCSKSIQDYLLYQPPMNNTDAKQIGIFGQWTIEKSLAYIWIQYVFYRNWTTVRILSSHRSFHLSSQQTTKLQTNSYDVTEIWALKLLYLCYKCANIAFQLPHQHTWHNSWNNPVSTDRTREEASSSANSCVWHRFGEYDVYYLSSFMPNEDVP